MQHISDPIKQLGSWLARSNNTVYQAATDGFVCAYNPSTNAGVYLYTDGSNPPITIRECNSGEASDEAGVSPPVRKGDYWKATGAATVYWIPLEP